MISALASVEGGEPLADSNTCQLGNLEPHRPVSFLLNDGRAIANSPASEHVIYPQPDEIAGPELTVDRQIDIARSRRRPSICNFATVIELSRNPFPQRALLADQASAVPNIRWRVGIGFPSSSSSPMPTRQISVDRRRSLPEKARCGDCGPSRPRLERSSSTLSRKFGPADEIETPATLQRPHFQNRAYTACTLPLTACPR